MVKNVVDVVFGGLAYWAVGYGLSYGDSEYLRNPFIGWGKFFFDPSRTDMDSNKEGWAYAAFLFQLSLSTTASTIVSGAVAERAKLKSYIMLGCLVILVQALPAHWIWDRNGFFFQLGVVDFAGCSAVHMVGGVIGIVATIYLKPRRNRFNEDSVHQMSSPTNALLGTFMLWWGWFGINSGSVWGITAGRWRLGARAAVATIMSSIGGGATSIILSFIKSRKLQVNYLIDGLLSSIVSITAICAVALPWQSLVIGAVSSAISISVLPLLEKLKIDDPVGIVPIHLTSSIWGMTAVGIFAEDDKILKPMFGQRGLIYSGSFRLLGIQMLCTLTIVVYSAVLGLAVLMALDKSPLGLRVTDYEEQIGADVIEHGLAGTNIARYHVEKPLSAKTFTTVTKAITKWKLQTKAHSRANRRQRLMQKQQERSENEQRVVEELRKRSFNKTLNGDLANGTVPPMTTNGFAMKQTEPSPENPFLLSAELSPHVSAPNIPFTRGKGHLPQLAKPLKAKLLYSSEEMDAVYSVDETQGREIDTRSRSERDSVESKIVESVVGTSSDNISSARESATDGEGFKSNGKNNVAVKRSKQVSEGSEASKPSRPASMVSKRRLFSPKAINTRTQVNSDCGTPDGNETMRSVNETADPTTSNDPQSPLTPEPSGSQTSLPRALKNKVAPLTASKV